jgi:hypothetical protein
MADIASLLHDAFTIYSESYTKIGEIGVEVADLEGSPRQPKKINQLIEATRLFRVIEPSVILSDDGDAIIGIRGEVQVINNLLIKLKRACGLFKLPAFPTPLTGINFEFNSDGGAFNLGPGQLGDLITNNGTDYYLLNMGNDGDVLVSTPTGLQWQSVVGNGIPSGGSTGQYLRKNSNTSYDAVWDTLTLSDVTDVTASVAEVNKLDGALWSTAESNTLIGINTGTTIQAQINALLSEALPDGNFWVGNVSDVATAVSPTGDVVFNNAGVFSISAGVIVDADINASAGITRSKLAIGTANRIVVNSSTGVMTDAAGIDPNLVLISDANGIPTHSGVTSTTLTYLDATSSIQTQLNARLVATITSAAQGDMLYYNGTTWINFIVGSNGQVLTSNGTIPVWGSATATGIPSGGTSGQYLNKIDATDYNVQWSTLSVSSITDLTASAADLNILDGATRTTDEINFLSGADSNLQDQITNKLTNNLAYNAIWVGGPGNTALQVSPGADNSIFTIVSGVPTWQNPPTPGNVSGPVSSTDNAIVRWNSTGGNSIQDSGIIIDDSNNITGVANLRFTTGSAIQSSQSAGNTLLIQAYDVDGAAYTTFITLTANNTPTMDINTTSTIGSAYIYRVGGTDISLADGGTGVSLADPGANRLWGWDDTDNAIVWITIGSGLTYDAVTNTLTASGGGGGISGPVSSTDNAIVRWDSITGTVVQNSTVIVSDTGTISAIENLTVATGGALRTSTSAANTLLLQAYDVDGAAYTTFATLTANNTPTMDLSASVTQGGAVIYRVGGTDVSLADGGTGASLADPGQDTILFWDDSASSSAWLFVDSTLFFNTNNIGVSANGIQNVHIRQSAALSVVGRASNSTGNVSDISSSADGDILRRSGTTLGFGTIGITSMTMNTSRLLGRTTASSGAVEEISVGGPLTFSSGALDITQASASNEGTVTTTAQTFAGDKTFNGSVESNYTGDSGSPDAAFVINRTLATPITASGHGFKDNTVFTRSTYAYAAYDAVQDMSGTNSYDHSVGFQNRLIHSSSGTTTNVYGFFTESVVSAGTVTNNYGMYIKEPTGAGTVSGRNIGIFIEDHTRGAAGNNWAIYSDGVTNESFFAGNVGIGINPTQKLHVSGNGLFTGTLTASNLSGTNTGDQTTSGTSNRITVATGSTTPVIDIAATYVGQSSITTLGTIVTGTWQGTAITDTYISSSATWNSKQAGDATLTALAAYNTNGILTQTASDTFTGRTITGTANEITVTNGNGVSGNPTLSLPSALTFTGKTVTGGTFTAPTITVRDNVFTVTDQTDTTKAFVFEASGITTATTRTLTIPNASGTIALTADLASYQPLDADLTAIAALASTGIAVRTASNTWAQRTITAGTAIAVTNGDGVSGNPTIALSHLGIQSLTDPNADRILFWDDSAGATAWLTVSTGLTLSGTTLTTSGGVISGLTSGRVPFSNGATSITDDDGLTYVSGSNRLFVGVLGSNIIDINGGSANIAISDTTGYSNSITSSGLNFTNTSGIGGKTFTIATGGGATDDNLSISADDLLSLISGNDIQLTCGAGDNIIMTNLPTSPVGLPAGAIWSNAGILTIV